MRFDHTKKSLRLFVLCVCFSGGAKSNSGMKHAWLSFSTFTAHCLRLNEGSAKDFCMGMSRLMDLYLGRVKQVLGMVFGRCTLDTDQNI